MLPEMGDTLGRYTLLKRLAAGGMGEIFLASRAGPLGFAPPIALKVLREELATDATFVEMLVDEAKISMFLNHQNVVSVLDFGEHNGRYYIAMEFVQGVTLKQLLETLRARGRKLELPLSIYVANELCRALKYAHTRTNHAGEPLNIIHRDVTPGNVLLSIQGEVKLTDFGIARAKNRVHETQAGVLKGKFGYMAPEMLRYERIDSRADLFCAGVILYEMIAGQHPVEGAGIMEAIQRLEEKNVQPPSAYNPEISKALDTITMRALEPKPDARWGSAAALGAALQDLALANVELRREIRSGAQHLSALIRELFPEAFENPIPADLAERFLAEAREREREARAQIERAAPAGGTPAVALVAAMAEDRTEERDRAEASGVDLRPVSSPELNGLSRSEVASMPTSHAISVSSSDQSSSTLIPGVQRRGPTNDRRTPHHSPQNGTTEERDTDEHEREVLARAAELAVSLPEATHELITDDPLPAQRGRVPENATLAFQAPDLRSPETGEIVIQFPDSSTDRARLHEEMIEEPSLPLGDATLPLSALSKEQIARAHLDDKTVAAPDAFGPDSGEVSGELDDGKTIATGVALPERRPYESMPPPAVRVIDPADLPPRYREEERPDLPARRGSYDDGATAFDEPSSIGDDPPTVIPTDGPRYDLPVQAAPQGQDDTLLDGINADEIARLKKETFAGRRRAESVQDSEPDTHLRAEAQDEFVWEDSKELGAQPKKLSGPLRIRVDDQGTPAIAESQDLPKNKPLSPAELPKAKQRPQEAPQKSKSDSNKLKNPPIRGGIPKDPLAARPPEQDDTSKDAAASPIIGGQTGRWIRGELPASDLSWGDDAAARRAVATRNVPNPRGPQSAPIQAPPVQQPHPGITQARPPAQLTQGGYSQQYPVFQGQPPSGAAVPYSVPAPPVQQRGWLVPVAISLAIIALASVLSVLLFTRAAWPELTFESVPSGAMVLVDGKVVQSKTPVTVKVKPYDEHRIELRLAGYPPRRIEPAIEAGFFQKRGYQVTFEEIKRVVHISPAPGRVFVNDQDVGSGSSVPLPQIVNEGPVSLRVEANGYKPWTMRFESVDQIPASLDVPLQAQ